MRVYINKFTIFHICLSIILIYIYSSILKSMSFLKAMISKPLQENLYEKTSINIYKKNV